MEFRVAVDPQREEGLRGSLGSQAMGGSEGSYSTTRDGGKERKVTTP
jgi:hypothetical protein